MWEEDNYRSTQAVHIYSRTAAYILRFLVSAVCWSRTVGKWKLLEHPCFTQLLLRFNLKSPKLRENTENLT